jgi:hypothetical protein
MDAGQDFRCKVESGGGSGNGSAFAGVDGLVSIAVGGGVVASDVRWQGDVADLFKNGKEIIDWTEADVPFAKLGAGDDFGMEFIVITEIEMLADADLPTRADQAFPFIWFVMELASKQDLDASVKKIARGGIVGAEGLSLKTATVSVEASGKHPCVIEDDEIVGTEQVGESAEQTITDGPG